jgi:hypothetical protein
MGGSVIARYFIVGGDTTMRKLKLQVPITSR